MVVVVDKIDVDVVDFLIDIGIDEDGDENDDFSMVRVSEASGAPVCAADAALVHAFQRDASAPERTGGALTE